MEISYSILLILNAFFSTNTEANRPDDPYIVCSGSVPSVNEVGPWPTPYAPDQFADNLKLCSAAYGRRWLLTPLNVGCFCIAPGAEVHCSIGFASSVLYRWQTTRGPMTSLCEQTYCRCTTEAIANSYADYDKRGQGIFNYDFNRSGLLEGDNGVAWYNPISNGTLDFLNADNQTNADPSTCSINCTTQVDCAGDFACRECEALIVPGQDSSYIATCQSSFGGRKRNRLPCPCNTTYVSHGCCSARDGIIWEDARAKLGELNVEDL